MRNFECFEYDRQRKRSYTMNWNSGFAIAVDNHEHWARFIVYFWSNLVIVLWWTKIVGARKVLQSTGEFDMFAAHTERKLLALRIQDSNRFRGFLLPFLQICCVFYFFWLETARCNLVRFLQHTWTIYLHRISCLWR